MVLVHGLLVILDSRFFSSVEVRRFVGIYTMGELKLIGRVEIYRQVGLWVTMGGERWGGGQFAPCK